MEFGMKRVVASVQVVAILNRIYNGSPVSIASMKATCTMRFLTPDIRSNTFLQSGNV